MTRLERACWVLTALGLIEAAWWLDRLRIPRPLRTKPLPYLEH